MARPLASLCVALAFLAAPMALAAEEGPKNTVTLLPIDHELGMYGIEWEHAAGPMTFYFAPGLRNPLEKGKAGNDKPLTLGLDVGLRFFAFTPAPRGFFVGPQVGIKYVNGGGSTPLAVRGTANVGVLIGYSLFIGDVGVISLAVGGEYYRQYEYDAGAITQIHEDLGTVFRAALGFAF